MRASSTWGLPFVVTLAAMFALAVVESWFFAASAVDPAGIWHEL